MCNACGNYCCGSDEFGQCGCDGCPEEDCWSVEPEDDFEDDYALYGAGCSCTAKRGAFICEAGNG